MDPAALRAEFPVLARLCYLNAGTDGPIPRVAAQAARVELEREEHEGRWAAHFARRRELSEALRAAYARVLRCPPADVALTTSTTDGIARALAGLPLQWGDEILTSDEEHPGLLGPLQAARRLRGVSLRQVPLARLADAVGPRTRLVACSHVGWVSGRLAPQELAALDVPVLLDGAQGVGAVPVDVRALGCVAYAGSGQKWLCGPDGLGMLYITRAWRERVGVIAPSYVSMRDPEAGLDAELHPDARRFDTPALPAEALAFALAAIELLEHAGWRGVHLRASRLAEGLAEQLRERGLRVFPRSASTLVSWADPDPTATRDRLAATGIVVRDLPRRPLLRASVGAWNDDEDLARLLAALPSRRSWHDARRA